MCLGARPRLETQYPQPFALIPWVIRSTSDQTSIKIGTSTSWGLLLNCDLHVQVCLMTSNDYQRSALVSQPHYWPECNKNLWGRFDLTVFHSILCTDFDHQPSAFSLQKSFLSAARPRSRRHCSYCSWFCLLILSVRVFRQFEVYYPDCIITQTT